MRRRIPHIVYFALAAAAALLVGLTWRQVRQARLDYALMSAVANQYNNREAVMLLNQGADPNARVRLSDQPSAWTVWWNSLWQRSPPRQAPSRLEPAHSMLEMAIMKRNRTIVRPLLEHGARDVDARIPMGRTLLMAAVSESDDDTARALLDHHASVDAVDSRGMSALMLAGEWSMVGSCMPLLLEYGANVNLQDHEGTSVLMYAANNDAAMLELLLAKGANVNAANHSGTTPLMVAAFSAKARNVELLLEHGANPNARNKDGVTALSYLRHVPLPGAGEEIIQKLKAVGATE